MLLIVGEAIVAYQRENDAPFTGPWPSGSPAIAAYVAARLGVPTWFVGGIGHDDHGQVMKAGLEAGGVVTDHLAVSPDAPTASAYITYRGEEREFDFRVEKTAAVQVTERDLGDLPERCTWLHMSGSALIFGEPLATTTLKALSRARAAGARISIDPNVRPSALSEQSRSALIEALQLADVLLPSEGELEALGLNARELAAGGATVCTTYGEGGATIEGGARLDALKVDAVDTDGAGDSFAAGFIAASLAGAPPSEAALSGIRVAAQAVQVVGPMTVQPR